MVGGLLVAIGALGTWAAITSAGRSDEARYVVVDRLIAPGQRIQPGDLHTVAMDLPEGIRSGAFTDPNDVAESVALGPIAAGELVQAGSVASSDAAEAAAELSFSVETDWAVAGTLRVGDVIDVFATDDRAATTITTLVLDDVVIRRVSKPGDDGLGADRNQTITVGITSPDAVVDAVTATRTATVTVVRVTDLAEGER
ncbi:MAG: SAF domain-containing protein [Aquihabitans sp.]